jgi:hypothetical protein
MQVNYVLYRRARRVFLKLPPQSLSKDKDKNTVHCDPSVDLDFFFVSK